MAKVEGIAKVKVDGQEAGKQLENLEAKAKELRKAIISVQKADILDNKKLKDLKTQLKSVNSEMKQVKNTTFSYQKVLNNLSGASLQDLNKAYRKLNADVKKLDRNTTEYKNKAANMKAIKVELAKVRSDMNVTGKASKRMMSNIADGFNKYGGMILGVVASLTGLVFSARKAIDVFNEFEAAESNLSALTKLTGDDLKYLSDSAKEMSTSITEDGVKITKSATDIENAFTTVGSQRPELLKNKEALKSVTEDALILAEASKMELAPAVTAVTSALNNFNLGADESRRVINVFGAGSQAGAADVEKLTKVFDKAGTTANLLGLSVEELVGVSEAVAPKFNDMSKAGNSLDKVLLKMKDNQIGYVDGVFNLDAALDEVRKKTEQGITVSSMFGVEHAKMVEVLLAEQDQIHYYTDAVTDSNVAIEQAITNTSNNAAALEQAKNRAQANAIVLGEKLAPALTFSTNAFSYLLKVLVVIIENWDTFSKYLKVSIITVGTYITVTKGATIAQNLYNKAVKIATVIQKAFNNSMKASPWGLIAGLIAGAVAAIVLFTKKSKEANKSLLDIKKAGSAYGDEMVKVKAKSDALFTALKNSKKGTDEHKAALKAVNEEYGKYLPNLLTEKSSLNEIEAAQKLVNSELLKNVAIKAKQTELTELFEKQIKTEKDIQEHLKPYAENEQVYEAMLTLVKNYSKELVNLGDTSDEIISETARKIKSMINTPYEIESGVKRALKSYTKLFKEVEAGSTSIQDFYNNLLKTVNKTSVNSDDNGGGGGGGGNGGDSSKVDDTKKINELIKQLNLQQLEDARQKAIEEENIWFEKEKKKIEISKASAELKAKAVETLEKVHKKKLLDIETKYNAETLKRFQDVNNFLAQQQAKLETDRDAILQRDIEKIQAKYDAKIKIIDEELAKENELHDQFAAQKDELERLRDDEIKAYKLQKEQEFADQAIVIREQYGLVSEEEKMIEELAALDEHLANKLLSEEEYESAVDKIKKKYADADLKRQEDLQKAKLAKIKKGIQDTQAVIGALSDFISAAKEAELAAVGDNEEAKKEIMKRYADKEFAVKIAQIAASTALAIMQAMAQLGPVAGAIASVIIAGTGALQYDAAARERDRIKGLAEGGEFPVTREQDGRNFNAVYGGNKSGLFTKPTVLVAEEGPEYVIPYSGLQNPVIRNFVDVIESARQSGSLRDFDYPKAISAGKTVKGYAEGGYTEDVNTQTQDAASNEDISNLLIIMINEIRDLRNSVERKSDLLKAYISYDDIEEAQETMNTVKNDVTIQ